MAAKLTMSLLTRIKAWLDGDFDSRRSDCSDITSGLYDIDLEDTREEASTPRCSYPSLPMDLGELARDPNHLSAPLWTLGDGCWKTLFHGEPESEYLPAKSVCREDLEYMYRHYELRRTHDLSFTVADGWLHVSLGGRQSAADVMSIDFERVGAPPASNLSPSVKQETLGVNKSILEGFTWNARRWDVVSKIGPLVATVFGADDDRDASTFAHLTGFYCWAPVVFVDKPTFISDVVNRLPAMPTGQVFELAEQRGRASLKVSIYQGPSGNHIEIDDSGQTIDWWTKHIKAHMGHMPKNEKLYRPNSHFYNLGCDPLGEHYTLDNLVAGGVFKQCLTPADVVDLASSEYACPECSL